MKGLEMLDGKYRRVLGNIARQVATRAHGCVLGVILGAMTLTLAGCGPYAQPGETAAERSRRHDRIARVNQSQMIEDIDKLLLLDKPSRLTDKPLP